MPSTKQILSGSLAKTEYIRNICVLAHVDHGKTSLSDTLLASNGIISWTLQGSIRFLDSRPDEQDRGITMESSAISLHCKLPKLAEEGCSLPPVFEDYMVNLIDSPGHIDFSSEVSTASRLCDSALIVVDAAEGVMSQTVTVLKQAWDEELAPILVINKIDRLVVEFQMTPTEAYNHVCQLLEQVNAVLGSFFSGTRMEQDYEGTHLTDDFMDDSAIYFDPVKNNVIFCSAVDGWGFNIGQFAGIYARKMGFKKEKLEKVLWGNNYFDPKTKRVVTKPSLLTGSAAKNPKPMAVQLIFDTIWSIYRASAEHNGSMLDKIVNSLSLKIPNNVLGSPDEKVVRRSIFNAWIPVSRSVLAAVARLLPSPKQAQKTRTKLIIERTLGSAFVDPKVIGAMTNCMSDGPVVAFISKVMHVPTADLIRIEQHAASPQGGIHPRMPKEDGVGGDAVKSSLEKLAITHCPSSEDESANPISSRADEDRDEVVIGVSRVYCGTIRVGDTLNLLGPKYDPSHPNEIDHYSFAIQVTGLYILMGRDLVPVKEAFPGNIIGIAGVGDKVIKCAALISPGVIGPSLASSDTIAPPILRVAVEPVDPRKIPDLEKGLGLLNMSDSSVEIHHADNGEYILATAGELHLERCLKDLEERFAKIEIDCSPPVVPFLETCIPLPDAVESDDGIAKSATANLANLRVTIKVEPLPQVIRDFLTSQSSTNSDTRRQELQNFIAKMEGSKISSMLRENVNYILSLSSVENACILFDATRNNLGQPNTLCTSTAFQESVISGFLGAIKCGPLAGEPLHGVACFVTELSALKELDHPIGSITSRRLISTTRRLVHQGVSQWSPRLMLATYKCEIQAPTEVLGKVYAVITRRKGKVLVEELKEGTTFFNVTATIPLIESLGFSDEIRKKTSGAANPQLRFDGFVILDEDPFWIPTTEEQLEHFGETSDRQNIALLYLESIRKRKGLKTMEKLVASAERIRTLKS